MTIKIPKTEQIDITLLKTDGQNPNSMSKERFNALKKNLLRYGFLVPIITNNAMMIADGEHDKLLDTEEFDYIYKSGQFEDFRELLPDMVEYEDLIKQYRDEDFTESVDKLGSLNITCPKCNHKFKKK